MIYKDILIQKNSQYYLNYCEKFIFFKLLKYISQKIYQHQSFK